MFHSPLKLTRCHGDAGIITCSMLQHHPSIENNCEAFKFISRRCGAAMFALLDIDWELTPCKWGTMVQTAVFREDDKALSARLGQEHMIAIYDLLSDVAVDALAPDGMEAFLARAIAPDGANCKVRFVNTRVWHGSLLPVTKTCSTTKHLSFSHHGERK